MPRTLFRLAMLGHFVLFSLHLWMVRRGAVPDTPLFREFQGFVWRSIPRWRIFTGLHALVFSLVAVAVGFALLAAFRPAGRPLFAAGLLSYLLFLRLEPRFVEADWSFIFGVISCGLGGMFTVLAITAPSPRPQSDGLWRSVCGISGVLASFLLFRFARGLPLFGATPQPWELSTFAVFFSCGYLLALSWWGSVAAQFQATVLPSSWTRRAAARSLFIHFGVGATLAVALLLVARVSPLWVGVVPFAPLVVACYAPISWFTAAGDTVVFSSQLASSGFDSALRNRLLLGILFQYLCLGLLVAVVRALRAPARATVLTAHGVLVLYWLPIIWLCQMLITHGAQ